MTDQQTARGRRAVACPAWKWMPGMLGCLASNPKSTIRIVHAGGGLLHHPNGGVWSDDGVIPVLEDPATLGCLMALAREALGEPEAHAVKYAYHWGIERHDSYSEGPQALRHDGAWDATWCADAVSGLDEPEAWLAALEAAGRR